MSCSSEKFLELSCSFGFLPRLYASPSDVEHVIQRARFYDLWTFSRLINDLLQTYLRDYPEDRVRHQDDGVTVSLTSQGFSGSSVFSLEFMSIIDSAELLDVDERFKRSCSGCVQAVRTGRSFIVKIGPYDDILREIKNYGEHVKGILNRAMYPDLLASAFFIDKTAAILYERVSNMVSFGDYYIDERDIPRIRATIDHLFSELKASWYNRGVPRQHDLFSTYHLTDRRERFLRSLREIASPDELRKPSINILGPGSVVLCRGRNPLDILEDSYLGKLKVLESPIHDDLNPYNILVSSSTPNSLKLIDFAGTRCRPVLQDLAKFEMSILFLLYDQKRAREPWAWSANLSGFRDNPIFQEWITIAIRLTESVDKDDFQTAIPSNSETNKFFNTIDSIRTHARCYSYTDWALEYEIALFDWALRATYWNDSSPAKRVLAYYVSCLLGHAIRARYSQISS